MGRPALRFRFGLLGRKMFYVVKASDGVPRTKHADGSIVHNAYNSSVENGDIVATRDGTTRGFEGYASSVERVELPEGQCTGL